MSEAYNKSLVWMRRDLRLKDNIALSAATKSSHQVALVFIFDTNILDQLVNKYDQRVQFIYDSLQEINSELKKYNSEIIIKLGDPKKIIPELCEQLNIEALFANEDYEPYALKRDQQVREVLSKKNTKTFFYKDQVIFNGKEVLKSDDTPYKVFTPYKRAWLKKFKKEMALSCKVNLKNFIDKNQIKNQLHSLHMKDIGFDPLEDKNIYFKGGSQPAHKSLKAFSKYISDYNEQRDFPADNYGTSKLSVHLRFGTISVRQCLQIVLQNKNPGSETWMSELIWREFYQMILYHYPHCVTGAFKKEYDAIHWSNNKAYFKAWQLGQTGFPIIDAGMRQLNTTGWMHNRVRMIVASFLVKDLLINWQWGEAYFAEKLIDFDLSANNGGWQWSASTGCDAQPYFRIFNPSLQSKKFDPDAEYIKTWVPELRDLTSPEIHFPEKSDLHLKANYPKPLVDHGEQKKKALLMYKAIKSLR